MFDSEIYIQRRKGLKENFKEGLLLFLGNEVSPINYAGNTYAFRQDSSFLYFFGVNLPSLSAIIDLDDDTEILFGDEPDLDAIVWTGKVPLLKELALQVGMTTTRPSKDIHSYLKKTLHAKKPIHFLPAYRAENTIKLSSIFNLDSSRVNSCASTQLIRSVVALRECKSDLEVLEIEEAVDLSVEMHLNAIRLAKHGMKESQVAAEVHRTVLAVGGDLAFPIIATKNGQTLHNYHYGNTIQEGDLFLLDAGAQNKMGYAGDLSSTFPVAKSFTDQQKEIYTIVFRAHQAAIQTLGPGINFIDVHKKACITLIEGLKSIGLMKGNPEEAFQHGAHALFFPCGVGHMLGLDVHDMEGLGEQWVGYEGMPRSTQFGLKSLRLAKKLKPGFVHTIEPGIYFIPELIDLWKSQKMNESFLNYELLEKYRRFGGIRNEENFLITRDGYRQLGKIFPKDMESIEALR